MSKRTLVKARRLVVVAAMLMSCVPADAVHAQGATPSVLNLSTDLVPLGIATRNLVPNQPTLDATPLFEAGVEYAKAHAIPKIIAQSGA